MSDNKMTPEYDEVKCTKETLSRTIIEIEKEYKILEINTITGYFGHFSHFQIYIKKSQ